MKNANNTIPAVIKVKAAKKLYAGRVKKVLKNKNYNIVKCGLNMDAFCIIINDIEIPREK